MTNNITVKNQYLLPLISSAFELLQGATVFSKLDLLNAYNLVRIQEADKWKTTFNTASSHHEYLVMAFVLTNAPTVFQALVNDVLRNMLNRFVFVYLDDILVFSRSPKEHVIHIQQHLLDNQVFVKRKSASSIVPPFPFWATSFLLGVSRWIQRR